MRRSKLWWTAGSVAAVALLSACSDAGDGTDPDGGGATPGIGGVGTGGLAPGGMPTGGLGTSGGNGAVGATGGEGPMGGGGMATGGAPSGGFTPTGGFAPTGGVAAGGTGGTTDVPPNAYCAPTQDWDPAWAELEAEIVVLVNQRRAEGANCGSEGSFPPAGPLTMDAELQCAARLHSMDMAVRNFFDHNNPDGESPFDRIQMAGFEGWSMGENIAAGTSTPEATVDMWMDSDGHCANIMSGDFTVIGVGYYAGGSYGYYWTQTFGG